MSKHIAIKLNAGNNTNGNPRRVYVVLETINGSIVDTIDEGFMGIVALSRKYPEIPIPPEFYTTPKEYRELLKMKFQQRETTKH